MIRKFGDFDSVKPLGEYEKLEKGGYVLVIKKVETVKDKNGNDMLRMCFDIAEGLQAGFFERDWRNQDKPVEDRTWHGMYWLGIPLDDNSKNDNFTKRKFKSFTDSLEDSNSGYHFDWDEQKFVGKQIGGLFHNVSRVYAGKEYVDTKLGAFTSVSKIHDQKYTLPKDKGLTDDQEEEIELYNSKSSTSSKEADTGSLSITSEDLPF